MAAVCALTCTMPRACASRQSYSRVPQVFVQYTDLTRDARFFQYMYTYPTTP